MGSFENKVTKIAPIFRKERVSKIDVTYQKISQIKDVPLVQYHHKLFLQYLAFFDHLPPSIYIFYGIKVYKKSIFWPPTPLLL